MTSVNIQRHQTREQPVWVSHSSRGSKKNASKRWIGTTRNRGAIFCSAGYAIQAKVFWSAGTLFQGKILISAGILPSGKHPRHPIFGRFVTHPKMLRLAKIERNFCDLFLPNTKSYFLAPILFKPKPQVVLPTQHQAEVLFRKPANASGKNQLQVARSHHGQPPTSQPESGGQVCSLTPGSSPCGGPTPIGGI